MLRIGVIGAGHWGPNLIRNFQDDRDCQVVRVADTSQKRLTMVSERFPEVKVSTSAEEVVSASDVDAVVVTTPTKTHYDLAAKALENGKHALVEKPITASVADAEKLCEQAERRDLVLMVGHVFLFNAGVRRVKEYIEEGVVGDIYYVSMVRTNLGPIRVDVNAAWDLAAHDISIANYWIGAEPIDVSAVGGSWVNEGIADAVFATMRYPSGVLVNLHVSWLNPRKARDITVAGEKAMLTFDDMNITEPVRVYDKRVTDTLTTASYVDSFASFRSVVRDGDVTIPKVSMGEPLRDECRHFVECIREGKTPLADGQNGLAVVRALEAMQKSLEAGGARQPL